MKYQVSVIIPTKNEEKNIGRCLSSIKNQTAKNIEIIVVDNHSKDQTLKIAKKFTTKVFLAGPERSAQRNFGAKKAKGEYLLFLDADMELEKELIAECLSLTKKEVPVIILSEKIVPRGFWSRCRALEKTCYLGDELIEAARFYKKKLFLKLNGFDENLIASEDWDLHDRAKRAGTKIGRTKNFVLHHEKETNPFRAAQKKYYYGLNLGHYLRKQKKLALIQYQPLRRAYLRHIKKLISQPTLFAGLVILKSAEYLGGGLGLVRGRFK